MTIVTVLSLKGAPGVTTLSCLLAATWPTDGRVLLVEADPAGGDLAARFGLSGMLGRHSLAAAVRRGGMQTPLDSHLQTLPGGLSVLAGAGDDEGTQVQGWRDVVERSVADGLGVVDIGRWLPDDPSAGAWLERSDGTVVVLGGDTASALHLRTRAPRLLQATRGKLGAVVVGRGEHDCASVAAFAGIRALGDLPFDVPAASVASGSSSAVRRLERSPLLAAVRRVGDELAVLVSTPDSGGWSQIGTNPPVPTAEKSSARRRLWMSWWPRRPDEAAGAPTGLDDGHHPVTDVRDGVASSAEIARR